MAPTYCVKEGKQCVRWVQIYFKDCLCNLKDEISFSLGLISLVSWGVAEIPQIITIFCTKSSHGVSLAFLLTWVAGDICNLVGCLLEPATLPTQYYTALLYTTSTIVLLMQIIYYDYIYIWYKRGQKDNNKGDPEEEKKPLKPPKLRDKSGIPIPNGTPKATPRRDYYYMSARSLAGSGTPPWGRYMRMRSAKSGPSAMELNGDSSSEDEASPASSTQPNPIPRSVPGSYGTFLAASLSLPTKSNALGEAYVRFSGRKLLQEYEKHSKFGQWLGWLMAAIYICGRVPQIWLNIRRGSVEGLNPLMFVFALIANVTYMGSILVRTRELENIKANMPWLLDAAFCVALDLFIILQYIYYRHFPRREAGVDHRDYQEAGKVAAS
ncbi:hypothetical protein RJT34_30406 [Clitoria ternatea]|uniref:Uncharacterized protein n=1 Tax=Clitoria ternatea TaxID=43366 RepID=A0AAN9I410_CLITE